MVNCRTGGALAYVTRSRHGAVFAAGVARVTEGYVSLLLTPVGKLGHGCYGLTVVTGAGGHERARRGSRSRLG
jgi:hypothetical protein